MAPMSRHVSFRSKYHDDFLTQATCANLPITMQLSDLQFTYDRVAKHYAETFFDELSKKPFDRELLDDFASTVHKQGLVCEIGCGPGQIAHYLRERGVEICGIDLSAQMVAEARRLNPEICFEQGNMLALKKADASFVAIVCFYAIIHIPRPDVHRALAEFYRVLQAIVNHQS